MIQTVAALPPGPARGLLADVVRMARVLYDALPKTGDPEEVRAELDRLLTWACDAARDIAVLDENLERLEDQSVSTKLPSGWMETLSRTERVHDRLVQRLLELISMLGRMRSNSAAILTSGEELEELAIDIEEHFAAHAEAVREIEELLGAR